MLQRGEHLMIMVRRRHEDGRVCRHVMRGKGLTRGNDEMVHDDELDHPDDLADWLEELAAQVRSSRRRRR